MAVREPGRSRYKRARRDEPPLGAQNAQRVAQVRCEIAAFSV
jgi:hypothetical protein